LFYTSFQPYSIYGGQFPQLEQHIVLGSEHLPLATGNYLRTQTIAGLTIAGVSAFKVKRLYHSATETTSVYFSFCAQHLTMYRPNCGTDALTIAMV